MTPDRARELLGGLAAGILTPEEQHMLFEAALHDQALFNEVADELEFAAFLQSPETRAQLANRIDIDAPRRPWWALRPAWLALAGVLAASTVLFVVVWNRPGQVAPKEAVISAQATPPVARQEPVPPPSPAPSPQPRLQTARHDMKQEVAPTDKAPAAEDDAKALLKDTLRRDEARAKATQQATAQRFANQAAGAGGGFAPARPVSPQPAAAPTPMSAPPPPSIGTGLGGAPPAATASLEGTVHDATGGAIRNATIDIVNNADRKTTRAASDGSGRFRATSLAPGGPYTVIAAAPGFKREERSGITLAENQPAQVDIPMQIGQITDTVEVSANSGLVNQRKEVLNPTRQIAVLDFANSTSQTQSGQQAADLLSSQLFDSGQRVIDREKVQQAQQSQAKAQSQANSGRPPSAKEAAALGSLLGADAVIVGTVKPSTVNRSKDSDIALTAQVIETKKARSMHKVAANGESLKGAANQLGLALESQLNQPLEGAVTGIDSGLVSVTFKAPAQPRTGARFEVYRDNRKIGELTLTSAYGQSGTGRFSGTGQPRRGDRVTSPR